VINTRSCKYSLDAPDDERKYRLEYVEQFELTNDNSRPRDTVYMLMMMSENIARNMYSSQGTINYVTLLLLVVYLCKLFLGVFTRITKSAH
jgi:hypothetical protein